MTDFLFENRGQIVGFVFIALIIAVIWAIFYGRKVIRTEKTDAVFGNPQRALGGWHWVITGVSFILISWLYFSWDAARAFFPKAANEMCQVAKLDYAINPMRTVFPLDNAYLKGTNLLKRENKQLLELKALQKRLALTDADNTAAAETLALMEKALRGLTSPEHLDKDTKASFTAIASKINSLEASLKSTSYPGKPTSKQLENAKKNLRWGDSGDEIPLHPESARGYKFAAAAEEVKGITADFLKVRNKNSHFLAQVEELKANIKSLERISKKDQAGIDESELRNRVDFVKNLKRVLQRIDDGVIFPPTAMDSVQQALVSFDREQKRQQGSLKYIDSFAMPGGKISAGSSSCSEQGSGRWLPKPSDTLRTLARISDPDIGYKGYPLLWYKHKPFGEFVDFLVPDWVAALIPGSYPIHNVNGDIESNLKSKVYDFATGNFNSFSIPVPMGHIWDSLLRVLAGLFFGIILGVPLGLFMGLSRFSKGFFDPMIELYRPVPPLAWAPLILTIFGIQDDGKIFLLFMVAFAIMVISARTGATGTHLSKIHAAHSLGASNKQILRKVILPNSLPEILTGIRIAIGVCWGTLVAAEMLAGTTGIGFVENVARKQSDYEIIWTTIIILGLLGLMFDLIMRWIIDKSIPWRGKG